MLNTSLTNPATYDLPYFLSTVQEQDKMEDLYHRLITAYFDKTISDEHLALLHDWVENTEANQDEFRETILVLEAVTRYCETPQLQEQNWHRIQSHIDQAEVHITVLDEEPLKVKRNFIKLSIAAGLIALMGIASILYFHFSAHRPTVKTGGKGVVLNRKNTANMSDTHKIKQ